MASTTKEVLTDLSPVIKVYTDGTVERLFGSPHVPPSPEDPTTGVSSKDVSISPAVSARLYLPKLTHPTQKLPILVYYHSGAFCLESAFSFFHHRYINLLSAEAEALVVSVEYRQAPEHPLPAAYEDSWDALQWVCSHVLDQTLLEKDQWITDHGDFTRVFIGGDSAGGNIAHNIALRAGSESLPGNVKIIGGILSHPYFWGSNPIGNEPKVDIEENFMYRLWLFVYPFSPGGIDNPLINPLAKGAPSLSGLGCSKILVCLAEKDQLTARGLVYVEEVKKSGWKGEVEVTVVEGEDHCFHIYDPETQTPSAKNLIRRLASFISH
ncbi:2-hydroxyisoflavanone dehydratase [Sesamum indicum]|uniref:2-hydroxyisoflavanone dehydratase n=1 Tax=Sesamum indicum TaxID=4182 RepID=A0A6I9STF2_SESIN|nr:2-hydroxyisoflavanone dehydratase [Sesamum indicum]